MSKRVTKQARKEALARKKKRQRLIWGIGILGVVLILVAAVASLASVPSYEIDPSDAVAVALGQQVYVVNCASCHGENLEGEEDWQESDPNGLIKAPPHDETGHTWHHSNAYLIESINQGGARLAANLGTSAMPAYEDILSSDEVAAVLAYIQSEWPQDIRAAQASR